LGNQSGSESSFCDVFGLLDCKEDGDSDLVNSNSPVVSGIGGGPSNGGRIH